MWLPGKENIIPEFDAEEAWLLLLLCGSAVRVGAVSLPPGDMRGTSESTAPVILHPSSPSPSPVINGWIRDNDSHRDPLQEGGHYADMVEELQIQPAMWWLTILYNTAAERKQDRTAVVQCSASFPHPFPLAITITHHRGRRFERKNNCISHSSFADKQNT